MKLKLIYGKRLHIIWTPRWDGKDPDTDRSCKYGKINLTTKTVHNTAWVMGECPTNPDHKGEASYKMSQRASKLNRFFEWK
jgi:hypothetical protein